MNNVDKQYLELLKDIIDNGVYKETRSGAVRSVFGRTMRFNLREGLPLLTTKRVYIKGVIHELLWFLKGDTNIKYLIDNDVHIWTDDALRWFRNLDLNARNRSWTYAEEPEDREEEIFYHGGHILMEMSYLTQNYYIRIPNTMFREKILPDVFQKNLTKELFEEYVKKSAYIERCDVYEGRERTHHTVYEFGELGPIYGKQWRRFGKSEHDQIQTIIDTLKTNPDDRRMVITGWNPDVLDEIALPACHMLSQFWTRELDINERLQWLWEHSNGEYDEWKSPTHETMDKLNVPKRALSCSFTMRSNDFCTGNPYNILSYSLLTYMLCEICNMTPDELIFNGNDVHVYENHIPNALKQLKRKGSNKIPKLKFNRKINNINDFKYEDFNIVNYSPDKPIKYELNVG